MNVHPAMLPRQPGATSPGPRRTPAGYCL